MFLSLHGWSLMALWKKWPSPLSQKGNQDPPIQKAPKKFKIFPASTYKIRNKNLAAHKKKIVGRVGYMENNGTNTDYHKFVRVGDQT